MGRRIRVLMGTDVGEAVANNESIGYGKGISRNITVLNMAPLWYLKQYKQKTFGKFISVA